MYLIPVDNSPRQVQSFDLFGKTLQFSLNYNTAISGWSFDLLDVDNDSYICRNYGLAVNAPCLLEMNHDFVIMMLDNSSLGINSISINDMGGRFSIYIMSKDDYYAAVRA